MHNFLHHFVFSPNWPGISGTHACFVQNFLRHFVFSPNWPGISGTHACFVQNFLRRFVFSPNWPGISGAHACFVQNFLRHFVFSGREKAAAVHATAATILIYLCQLTRNKLNTCVLNRTLDAILFSLPVAATRVHATAAAILIYLSNFCPEIPPPFCFLWQGSVAGRAGQAAANQEADSSLADRTAQKVKN